jgi:hypothetical protein
MIHFRRCCNGPIISEQHASSTPWYSPGITLSSCIWLSGSMPVPHNTRVRASSRASCRYRQLWPSLQLHIHKCARPADTLPPNGLLTASQRQAQHNNSHPGNQHPVRNILLETSLRDSCRPSCSCRGHRFCWCRLCCCYPLCCCCRLCCCRRLCCCCCCRRRQCFAHGLVLLPVLGLTGPAAVVGHTAAPTHAAAP